MTDFTKVHLTVASTGGGTFHSVGFDVRSTEWQEEIKKGLEARDSDSTLRFREEEHPRDKDLNDQWIFVWVVMTDETPLSVLLYLGSLSQDTSRSFDIRFRPQEFP